MARGGSRSRSARSGRAESAPAGTRGACGAARGCRGTPCGAPYKVARMRFDGKTALITGGAKGIGAATATLLAREGATVVVADFDEAGAQETASAIGGHAIRCDVTAREEVEAAVEAAMSHGGSLDI